MGWMACAGSASSRGAGAKGAIAVRLHAWTTAAAADGPRLAVIGIRPDLLVRRRGIAAAGMLAWGVVVLGCARTWAR